MKDYYIEENEWLLSVFHENRVRGNGLKIQQAGLRLEIKSFLTPGNARYFISVLAKPQRRFKDQKVEVKNYLYC